MDKIKLLNKSLDEMDIIRNDIDEKVKETFEKVNIDKLLKNPELTLQAIYLNILKLNKDNFIKSQNIGRKLAKGLK